MHNAFQKGLIEFVDIPEFLVSIYYYFKGWPTRITDFEKIQKQLNLPIVKFIKHVPTRWLTIGPAIDRILAQFTAIHEYFLVYIPNSKTNSISNHHYKEIVKNLKDSSFKCNLLQIKAASEIFARYTGMFQKVEPLIHVLYKELKDLTLILVSKVLKEEIIVKLDLLNEDLFITDNLLSLNQIEYSSNCKMEFLKLDEKTKSAFLFNVQKFYINSATYLIKSSPLLNKNLKYFTFLDPKVIKTVPNYYLSRVAGNFGNLEVDCILDEFKLFKLNNLDNIDLNYSRIDEFWAKVNKTYYPNLVNIVQMSLSLSHGNSDVERGFSHSALVLDEKKSNLAERTLNARLNTHTALKMYDMLPENVPITDELIKLALQANKSYKLYLENEKIKKKMEEEAVLQREKNMLQEEQLLKERILMTKTIEDIEQTLNSASKDKNEHEKLIQILIQETNKKLKTAINQNDMSQVTIAQTLIENIEKRRKAQGRVEKDTYKLTQEVKKRKGDLIKHLQNKQKKI